MNETKHFTASDEVLLVIKVTVTVIFRKKGLLGILLGGLGASLLVNLLAWLFRNLDSLKNRGLEYFNNTLQKNTGVGNDWSK